MKGKESGNHYTKGDKFLQVFLQGINFSQEGEEHEALVPPLNEDVYKVAVKYWGKKFLSDRRGCGQGKAMDKKVVGQSRVCMMRSRKASGVHGRVNQGSVCQFILLGLCTDRKHGADRQHNRLWRGITSSTDCHRLSA